MAGAIADTGALRSSSRPVRGSAAAASKGADHGGGEVSLLSTVPGFTI